MKNQINIRSYKDSNLLSISIDETITDDDLEKLSKVLGVKYNKGHDLILNYNLLRKTDFLNHDVFNK